METERAGMGMRRATTETESEMMELERATMEMERATMEMEVIEVDRAEKEDAACGQDHSPDPGGSSLSFNAANIIYEPTAFLHH